MKLNIGGGMLYIFEFDKRLGIAIPSLERDWNFLDKAMQEEILSRWEEIRGNIPDRVKQLETEINQKQTLLFHEEDFLKSCDLNSEISELASIINDLWLWFRSKGKITAQNQY